MKGFKLVRPSKTRKESPIKKKLKMVNSSNQTQRGREREREKEREREIMQIHHLEAYYEIEHSFPDYVVWWVRKKSSNYN